MHFNQHEQCLTLLLIMIFVFFFFFQFQWFWASIHMDACADESLYHFTATVSHRNLNKTVHPGG